MTITSSGIVTQLYAKSAASSLFVGNDMSIFSGDQSRPPQFVTSFYYEECGDSHNSNFSFGNHYNFEVSQFGDRIGAVYLQIDLLKNAQYTNRGQLIPAEDLATAMIDRVDVMQGKNVIRKITSEEMHIMESLQQPTDKTSWELTGRTCHGAGAKNVLANDMSYRHSRFYLQIPVYHSNTPGMLLKDRLKKTYPLIASHLSAYTFCVYLAPSNKCFRSTSGDYNKDLTPTIKSMRLVTENFFFHEAIRQQIANDTHVVLYTETRMDTFEIPDNYGSKKSTFELEMSAPIKQVIWFYRKDSVYGNETTATQGVDRFDFSGTEMDPGHHDSFADENPQYLGFSEGDAFAEAHICFGNTKREQQDAMYFRLLEARHHHTRIPNEIIYTFSPAYDPENDFKSTGALASSRIPAIKFHLFHVTPPAKGTYFFLTFGINLSKIESGVASSLFAPIHS